MTMRIDVDFDRPLTREQRTEFLLIVAGLAKSRAAAWRDGGHGAVVTGTALGRERVAEALAATSLPVTAVCSSLSDDEDAVADDTPAAAGSGRERLRPMGR